MERSALLEAIEYHLEVIRELETELDLHNLEVDQQIEGERAVIEDLQERLDKLEG